jgi:hypothetical protein
MSLSLRRPSLPQRSSVAMALAPSQMHSQQTRRASPSGSRVALRAVSPSTRTEWALAGGQPRPLRTTERSQAPRAIQLAGTAKAAKRGCSGRRTRPCRGDALSRASAPSSRRGGSPPGRGYEHWRVRNAQKGRLPAAASPSTSLSYSLAEAGRFTLLGHPPWAGGSQGRFQGFRPATGAVGLRAALEPFLQLLEVPGHLCPRLPSHDERDEQLADPVPLEVERDRHARPLAVASTPRASASARRSAASRSSWPPCPCP